MCSFPIMTAVDAPGVELLVMTGAEVAAADALVTMAPGAPLFDTMVSLALASIQTREKSAILRLLVHKLLPTPGEVEPSPAPAHSRLGFGEALLDLVDAILTPSAAEVTNLLFLDGPFPGAAAAAEGVALAAAWWRHRWPRGATDSLLPDAAYYEPFFPTRHYNRRVLLDVYHGLVQ